MSKQKNGNLTREERAKKRTPLECLEYLVPRGWMELPEYDIVRAALIEHGPGVSREFVEEKTKYIAEYPSQHRLEVVLRQAGVRVKEGK